MLDKKPGTVLCHDRIVFQAIPFIHPCGPSPGRISQNHVKTFLTGVGQRRPQQAVIVFQLRIITTCKYQTGQTDDVGRFILLNAGDPQAGLVVSDLTLFTLLRGIINGTG